MLKLKLTIKHKFILAGVLTFVSMLSILSIGLFTTTEFKKFGDIGLAITKIESGMLMLRRNEKDFLSRKNLKYQAKFNNNYETLQTRVNSLKTALDNAKLDTVPADNLKTTLNNYKVSFNNIISLQQKIGLHSKDGLYGSLRKVIHNVESEINVLGDQRLRADMLLLRRNEKDFMLRHDMKYLEKFTYNTNAFNNDLSNSEYSLEAKEKLKGMIKQYQTKFGELVKTNQLKGLNSNQGLMGEMRTTVHNTETMLKNLSKELNDTIKSQVGSLDRLMTTTTLIALVLAIFVTGIISWIALSIIRPIQSLASTMTQATNNSDLSLRVKISTDDEIGTTAIAFNTMLEKFQNIVVQVNGSSTQMSAAAEELSVITKENSSEIESQSLQTDQVATAINEMSSTVQEVSRNASDAASSANETMNQAETGRKVVNASIESMGSISKEIEQASTVIHKLEEDGVKIGAVLDVIRGIAEQTNLLALNAAIEAARAGEQGRGFAVVADEVRTLASRTQESTQEIQQMIESLQSGTAAAVVAMDSSSAEALHGVEKISTAGDALSTIVSGITHINDMNTQIANAAKEQSVVAEEINQNVVKISDIAVAAAANSSQTQVASEELSRLSIDLQELVSQFKS